MIAATYSWRGGSEPMLRFGPATGPVVIAALPLFEEANRTRAFVVTLLRALAVRGVASALPDLPGAGESSVTTAEASMGDWQSAFSAAAATFATDKRKIHAFGLRGGALIDATADVASRYHLAPVPGANLVRDLVRMRLAAAKEDGERFDPQDIAPPGPPIDLAGNSLSRQLLADLSDAQPATAGPRRVARLETDAQPADIKFDAAPLWRRAEPGNDPALAALVADDIAEWIAACAA